MACTEEYIQFVCSQLCDVGSTRAKKMFGEWMALSKLAVALIYGLVLAYIRCRTKSTLCSIMAHAALNSFLG